MYFGNVPFVSWILLIVSRRSRSRDGCAWWQVCDCVDKRKGKIKEEMEEAALLWRFICLLLVPEPRCVSKGEANRWSPSVSHLELLVSL